MTTRNDTVDLIGLQHFDVLPFLFRIVLAVTYDGLVTILKELVFQLINQFCIENIGIFGKIKPINLR